jgi:small ligand-binding sensory domain FIST
MEFHSALAESADVEEACDAVAKELQRYFGTGGIDLLLVFASASYGPDLDRLPVILQEKIGAKTLVGCTGAGQLHELAMQETTPAVSVLAARLPNAHVAATAIANADLPHADAPPSAWRQLLPDSDEPTRGMIVLGEPFECDMRALIAGLDFVLPTTPKVGGLASGSHHPAGNALFCGRQRINQGAVVVTLSGAIAVEAVVSQGCRPIGKPGKITKADRNRLASIDDMPVKNFLEKQLRTLPESDLQLVDGNPLFLGIASDPFTMLEPAAGDFLVRNVLGIDDDGHLVVGEHLSVGRSVQLHLRDGSSGLDDLQSQLERSHVERAQAAVMFRCVGREGRDHERFASLAPGTPLVGCTCNGEIGPVGGVTHLHGYTAACLLLREERAE